MKIFLDSADMDEIRQFYLWGIADGITTNPSLMKKAVEKRKKTGENIDLENYIREILFIARATPVSLEVTETTAEGMIREGRALYHKFKNEHNCIYIKIPVNTAFQTSNPAQFEGITAIRTLHHEKIPVNCTLIFTPEQAVLAAKAGATVVSPFAGRMDDYLRDEAGVQYQKSDYFPQKGYIVTEKLENGGEEKFRRRMLDNNGIVSGIQLVQQCVQILEHYQLKTEVLAASLRNARQVREAMLVGAHIATLPFSVVGDLLRHPKTCEGMKLFTQDIVPEYAQLTKK